MNADKVLNNIKKLLAMSNDTSSPEEAMIAAKLARKLMDKHQVDHLDLNTVEESDFGTDVYYSGMKSRLTTLSLLGVSIAKYNDCQAAYISSNILFKGFKADTAMAVDMMKYLVQTMYSTSKKLGYKRAEGTSYRLGFVSGVAEQITKELKERESTVMATGTSLVVCKSQLVVKEFGSANYRRKSTSYRDSDAHATGKLVGNNITISRQGKLA